MIYQQIINNINMLLKINNMTINDLSRKTGISLNGLKNMMESGSFKIESLDKISKAINIPLIVLLSDKIIIREKIIIDDFQIKNVVNILWTGGKSKQISTESIDDKKIEFNTQYYSVERELSDMPIVDGDESELSSLLKEVNHLVELKNSLISENKRFAKQMQDKEEILDFVKRESLFAFGNIIRLLMENRQANDGGIAPDKLNDITRSKIFDESFLKTLLDGGYITESDYLFFSTTKNKPLPPAK